MSTKFFFLVFTAFVMLQTTIAAEDKAKREHLVERIAEIYNEIISERIETVRKTLKTIINDESENNNVIRDRKYTRKVAELKVSLQRASLMERLDNLRRYNDMLLSDITETALELEEYLEIKPNLNYEQFVELRNALLHIANGTEEMNVIFADRTVQEIENYWYNLTTAEQQENQNLRETLNEIESNEPNKSKKLHLLERIISEMTNKNGR